MFTVFLQGLQVYQDIVYIADAKLVKVFAESVVDKSLSCSRGIGEAKWYDKELKEAVTRSEGGFPFVAFFDSNLVETGT